MWMKDISLRRSFRHELRADYHPAACQLFEFGDVPWHQGGFDDQNGFRFCMEPELRGQFTPARSCHPLALEMRRDTQEDPVGPSHCLGQVFLDPDFSRPTWTQLRIIGHDFRASYPGSEDVAQGATDDAIAYERDMGHSLIE
jgi:hypothetical protein